MVVAIQSLINIGPPLYDSVGKNAMSVLLAEALQSEDLMKVK
jgi:hypothetical protein